MMRMTFTLRPNTSESVIHSSNHTGQAFRGCSSSCREVLPVLVDVVVILLGVLNLRGSHLMNPLRSDSPTIQDRMVWVPSGI